MEVYTGGNHSTATGASCDGPPFNSTHSNPACVPTNGFNADGSGGAVVADQTVYHTYGVRIVSDGAASLDGSTTGNYTKCVYLDGTQLGCNKAQYTNNAGVPHDAFEARETFTLQNVFCPGPQACQTPNNVLTGNQDVYFDHATIFGCPSWALGGISVTGPECLNTTADVTGRLAGPP